MVVNSITAFVILRSMVNNNVCLPGINITKGKCDTELLEWSVFFNVCRNNSIPLLGLVTNPLQQKEKKLVLQPTGYSPLKPGQKTYIAHTINRKKGKVYHKTVVHRITMFRICIMNCGDNVTEVNTTVSEKILTTTVLCITFFYSQSFFFFPWLICRKSSLFCTGCFHQNYVVVHFCNEFQRSLSYLSSLSLLSHKDGYRGTDLLIITWGVSTIIQQMVFKLQDQQKQAAWWVKFIHLAIHILFLKTC